MQKEENEELAVEGLHLLGICLNRIWENEPSARRRYFGGAKGAAKGGGARYRGSKGAAKHSMRGGAKKAGAKKR